LRTEIQRQIYFINTSPSSIPKKDTLFLSSFGFDHVRADWMWIQAVQYIGNNVVWGYRDYLYYMLENITTLNKEFLSAYTYGQLLLPISREEDAENWEVHTSQAIEIGKKGIQNTCDMKKIRKIQEDVPLETLQEENWGTICPILWIVIGQGFLYSYYLEDFEEASKWYKVATLQENTPEGMKMLYSLSLGKSWNSVDAARTFSYFADIYAGEDVECREINHELQKILPLLHEKRLPGKAVEDIQNLQQEFFPFVEWGFSQNCPVFIQKMIREINIWYLTQEQEKYEAIVWIPLETLEDLEKIESFIPTDFQQYETYGMQYQWNSEKKKMIHRMEKYNKK